jgi:hypothetical protein
LSMPEVLWNSGSNLWTGVYLYFAISIIIKTLLSCKYEEDI